MPTVVEEIMNEVKIMDQMEQQILLTKLRVKNLQVKSLPPVANPEPGTQALTMEEISNYTHQARRKNES